MQTMKAAAKRIRQGKPQQMDQAIVDHWMNLPTPSTTSPRNWWNVDIDWKSDYTGI